MGPELLVLDLLVVEGLAQHEEVAGGEADAELRRPDGEGGNPIIFPHGTPFDVHHGPVVLRRVRGRDVEPRFDVSRQPELALRHELWLMEERRTAAPPRGAVLKLETHPPD